MRTLLALLLALPLAAACQSDKKAAPIPGESEQAEKLEPVRDPGPVPQDVVKFKIDGEKLPPIALGQETLLLAIPTLPPIEQWKRLIVTNEEGLNFRASQPAQLTGKRTMKLVRKDDNSYDFLVTQLADTGALTIRNKRSKVKVIEIHSPDYEPPAPPKPSGALALTIEGKASELNKAALDLIERTPEPHEQEKRDTWLLMDLLGKKRLSPEQTLVLKAAGKELTLSQGDLADKATLHIIKRNRRGAFHYRGWSRGSDARQTSELRNLIAIELR